jgi:hypothetical protein
MGKLRCKTSLNLLGVGDIEIKQQEGNKAQYFMGESKSRDRED